MVMWNYIMILFWCRNGTQTAAYTLDVCTDIEWIWNCNIVLYSSLFSVREWAWRRGTVWSAYLSRYRVAVPCCGVMRMDGAKEVGSMELRVCPLWFRVGTRWRRVTDWLGNEAERGLS